MNQHLDHGVLDSGSSKKELCDESRIPLQNSNAPQSEPSCTAQELLEMALQASQAGAWRWDVGAEKIFWSPQLENLFGLKAGEFSGKYEEYLSYIHPEDRDRLAETIQKAILTCERYEVEHRVIWPSGEVRWLLGKGKAFYDAQGRLTQ